MIITTPDTNIETPSLPGREYQFSALGTWGGATAVIEAFQDGDWRAVPDGSFTANFEVIRVNGPATSLRIKVTGTSGTTSLSVNITPLASP
jgi:hypothetical protein